MTNDLKNFRRFNQYNKFIQDSNIKYNFKFDYSKVEYINNYTHITIICPVHGEFKQTPSSHLKTKTGCTQCGLSNGFLSPQDRKHKFINNSIAKYGDKFNYSKIDKIENDQVEVVLICKVHGEFKIKAYRHLQSKYGCQKCGLSGINAIRNTLCADTFVEKAQEKFGMIYDYSKVKYISATKPVEIICSIHGSFYKTPNNHLTEINGSKGGCSKCYSEYLKSKTIQAKISKFLQDTLDKFGHTFIYDFELFRNSTTKINIKCLKCLTQFQMKPFDHLSYKTGCPTCGRLLNDKMRTKTTEYFVQRARQFHKDKYDYSKAEYISDQDNVTIICKIHGEFKQTPNNHACNKGTGCPKCAWIESKPEQELQLLYSGIQNDRKLIAPLELDIVNYENKIAIEFNGVLFHSFGYNFPNTMNNYNKKYHLNKTEKCESLNFQLFHIFENEWIDPIKQKIWKSMLNVAFKQDTVIKIHARKCIIKEISNETYKEFVNLNHMQGYRGSKIKLGLYFENELVSIMSFSAPQIDKTYEYELVRFCSKLNTIIIGGSSKLLRYFVQNYSPKSILSYADRRWSKGNLYSALGFNLINITPPNYSYVGTDGNTIYDRRIFQKHKIKEYFKQGKYKIKTFNSNLTELENMLNNDYRILYDSGNLKYGLHLKN